MNKGDYAVYSISATGLVRGVLEKAELPKSYIKRHGDTFSVPRLCVFWRGDAAEQSWADDIRAALLKADDKADIAITAEPWSLLPSYPQGDLSL